LKSLEWLGPTMGVKGNPPRNGVFRRKTGKHTGLKTRPKKGEKKLRSTGKRALVPSEHYVTKGSRRSPGPGKGKSRGCMGKLGGGRPTKKKKKKSEPCVGKK